jgi:hypothetical protein
MATIRQLAISSDGPIFGQSGTSFKSVLAPEIQVRDRADHWQFFQIWLEHRIQDPISAVICQYLGAFDDDRRLFPAPAWQKSL